ncbi:MAG: hypothetical protein ABIY37_17790, partial [Devosia sp.]
LTVLPSRANIVRAYAAEHPGLSPFQLASELSDRVSGLKPREVSLALGRGDKRRIKSIAK